MTENDSQIRNYIEVKGIIDNDVNFDRLELIQYPSKRILDSKDRNSTFKIVAINQNQSQFTYKKILNNSLKNGLYYINMYSDGVQALKGWVILKNPSTEPHLNTNASKTLKTRDYEKECCHRFLDRYDDDDAIWHHVAKYLIFPCIVGIMTPNIQGKRMILLNYAKHSTLINHCA